MSKELSELFLNAIEYEKSQDIKQTTELLQSSSLKTLVSSGYAISKLILENIRSGIGGKLFLELGPDHATSTEIAGGNIRTGDIVSIRPSTSSSKDKKQAKLQSNKHHKPLRNHKDYNKSDAVPIDAVVGVVTKINEKVLIIAIEENQEKNAIQLYSCTRLYVFKTVNDITYKRMESTMRKLSEFKFLSDKKIVQYLLNEAQFIRQSPISDVKFENDQLNESQKTAIKFSLANSISIIHGPPGTGKTYTLVELIQQLVHRGQRVLVCGPSNISVDTILERLSKVLPPDSLLRIGHPARLLEKNLSYSLDVLSKTGDFGSILKDILNDIDKTIRDIRKMKKDKDRREGWKLVKELRQELKEREGKAITEFILKSKVIVATLHGSSSRELCSVYKDIGDRNLFDTLIIDEVSQSLEPQCWIPIISHYKSDITKLVLAGDNQQLSPTIKTTDNSKIIKTLGTTLFDRLVKNYGDQFKLLLNVQYRMNKDIMQFPSEQMYDNKLVADESVSRLLLNDLSGVDDNDETMVPLLWYDTQGDEFPESSDDAENADIISSKYNEGEALIVKDHVIKLMDSNISQEHIGIISPYSAQVSYLKKLLREKYPLIEIQTVDGFQGREKEVIILTLVRSNEKFEVGFLKEERRLNVAMTRPKKQLCIVGNMEMLERSRNKYLKNWANWNSNNSEIRYPDISELLEIYS
ncbi:hypothetical protein TBLA_0C00960 [Henningerozyma blattae CBS 6284]|uniref:DNA helicase n=1 Tax=Henningerozyma blattae (strain ATCC 34711 / CBS 6284 / DSM 70876 / NBRC 10599 / NRRL Y-10934 / UCD 77-7) TaxID=1071380 RepID=I2H0K9_HENB6|nr:hypothetical protein TBLA_0C00960 [Tetrapisispora blattae CBS 6284]CCH59911.1 hypothetical protein TBLA_0C00960 [Tetrapisispora blattae CBS 6284]